MFLTSLRKIIFLLIEYAMKAVIDSLLATYELVPEKFRDKLISHRFPLFGIFVIF